MNYKLYKNYFIFSNHGDCKQEFELGQKFVLDTFLYGDNLEKIQDAISDDKVKEIVDSLAINRHFDLIQSVASGICEEILKNSTSDIKAVRIEVKKPSSPIRVGPPGGLVKYVSSTYTKKREGEVVDFTYNMEDFNYTKIRSARVFNKDMKYEVDLEVAFPMEESILNDNVAFSYSYTRIYDIANDITKESVGMSPEVILKKIVDFVYEDNNKVYRVRGTIRDFIPENDMSLDYMEYQLTR